MPTAPTRGKRNCGLLPPAVIGPGHFEASSHFPLPSEAAIVWPPVKARWTNIATLLIAPAVLCAVAPFCGDWHWTIDLLASFAVQSAWWLSLGAITLLICRKWWRALTFAAFAGLAIAAIAPGWNTENNFPGFVENGAQIRVLSLNLLHSNSKGHEAALKVVRELQPDVIWCAEYTPAWQEKLRAGLGDYPHRREAAQVGSFGAALFSKLPLAGAEMIDLGHSWAPAGRAVLATKYGSIGFLGVHPPPPGLSRSRTAERNQGLAAIPAALKGLPNRCIVAGDFNATPWNRPFQQMRTAARLSPGSTTSWLPTWPGRLPAPLRIPIDHVLVTGSLTVARAQLGKDFGSDHLPLFAVIQVVPK